MFVDSHCHLDRVDLNPYGNIFRRFVEKTRENLIDHMLCVAIDLEAYPQMLNLVEPFDDISVTVGVHPNEEHGHDPDPEELVALAQHPKNIAIGETGLDYYRSESQLEWQQTRFRHHIQAAKAAQKPLIIHTRDAKEDTLQVMASEEARDAGGVMHCFTEDWEMAKAALDMGFYISFSGIVTFKNADNLREVVKQIPSDRLLIETDAPYLAPVPHRGKVNEPRYVSLVAQSIADLRNVEVEELATITSQNFFTLFSNAPSVSS